MQRSKELQRRDSELLEVIGFWKEPEDFKDLETVSSSRSIHAPIEPLAVPTFSKQLCRDSCHRFNKRDVKIFPGGFFDDSSSVASTPAPAGRSKATAGVSPDSARGDLERGDEQPIGAQIQSIPQSRFVGSLLTVELPSLVGEFHSKNFMVEQPKNNVSDLQFEKLPKPTTFTYWKTNFKTEVCSGSGHPAEAMPWI